MNQLTQKTVQDALRTPRRVHKLFPLCFVSESTRTEAKRCFDLISKEPGDILSGEYDEIKRLIDDSPRSDAKNDGRNLVNVVNWDGFTLLQRSVIKNNLAVVKLLLKKGCDVNSGICSFPLHLACRLGHVQIAQLLLSYGARADLECTVCYPEEHKLKTCPDQIHCLAYQPVFTPILYALCGDHDPILPLLITHESSRSLVRTDYLLHDACKMGATACALYLLQHYPEQLEMENSEGRTPLQISLVNDTDGAVFLVQNGAKLSEIVFLTNDTGSTLHELYRSKATVGLVKATKFAVEHGFRSHINARDLDGNTALYVLLRHVGRTVRSSLQSEYDRELQESVKLLLHHGSNPNIPNHVGENALHAALSDTSARPLYVSRHGQVRRLKAVLREIYKVAEILLAHGAMAGSQRACVAPPLYYVARIFDSLQPEMFVVVQTPLKHLFVLLCNAESCGVNVPDACGLTVSAQLLNASYRWIAAWPENGAFASTVLAFLSYVLQHFLRNGLDANASLRYWTPRLDETVESNYFKEVLMFANLQVRGDSNYYDSIRHLMMKLLQRGGNPNLISFDSPTYVESRPSDGAEAAAGGAVAGAQRQSETQQLVSLEVVSARSGTIHRDAPIGYIIVRAVYLQDGVALHGIVDILRLFRRTLTQSRLSEFVRVLQRISAQCFPTAQLPAVAADEIVRLSTEPRRLKELSRIAIAQCVDWKLAKRCSGLPLPKPLLQYLLNFDL